MHNQVYAESASVMSLEKSQEIDLRLQLLVLWKRRFLIVGVTCVSVLIAAFEAFVVQKPLFESSALLLPTQASGGDQLGGVASLLGKKSGSGGDLELYQSLLKSRTVMHKLLSSSIKNFSDTGKGRSELLFQIMKLDTGKAVDVEGAVKSLAGSITVGSKENGSGGILEVKVLAGQPWLAQQIGSNVLTIGQEELRIIRVLRSEVVMPKLEVAMFQAKSEWDSIARQLTYYRDRNRSIVLPDQLLAVARMEMEKQAKEQKYLLARREYELQSLERAKATPPMMILDSASLPTRKSRPRRMLMLEIGAIVGFIGSSCLCLLYELLLAKPRID